jgi:hypothetical protein
MPGIVIDSTVVVVCHLPGVTGDSAAPAAVARPSSSMNDARIVTPSRNRAAPALHSGAAMQGLM